ncbi:MAG: Uma2 family endonuclease [Nocardioides sp.]
MTTTTGTTGLPTGRPFTVADLDAIPDDGNRYELLDGALIVTPAPAMRHQRAVTKLTILLGAACPSQLEVFVAPFDVRLADDTNVQPDVLVARRTDLTEANLPVAPLLAVEILSPSTRTIDLHSKRDRLRRAGCPSYWVVDPIDARLIAWELNSDEQYVEVADVSGDDSWTATEPFSVTVTPARLID